MHSALARGAPKTDIFFYLFSCVLHSPLSILEVIEKIFVTTIEAGFSPTLFDLNNLKFKLSP